MKAMILCISLNLDKREQEIRDFLKFTLIFKYEETIVSKIKKVVNVASESAFEIQTTYMEGDKISLTNFLIKNKSNLHYKLDSFKLNGIMNNITFFE